MDAGEEGLGVVRDVVVEPSKDGASFVCGGRKEISEVVG